MIVSPTPQNRHPATVGQVVELGEARSRRRQMAADHAKAIRMCHEIVNGAAAGEIASDDAVDRIGRWIANATDTPVREPLIQRWLADIATEHTRWAREHRFDAIAGITDFRTWLEDVVHDAVHEALARSVYRKSS